jgi:GDP-4-dehydro-6-deoxy-D-mannose reductase
MLDQLGHRAGTIAWHRPGGTPPAPQGKTRWVPVDLLDRKAVMRALATHPPRFVCHLAGAPSVESSWISAVPHLQVNVLGTHHLLEAVRALGRPCRVLVVSSALVYRVDGSPISESAPLAPTSPYGFTKLAQDQLALRSAADDGLDVVVARPFNHAGPRQAAGFALSSFARQIARIEAGLDPPVIRVGNLDARRDLTDVRDVVRAYEALMHHGRTGRAYNVCRGVPVRIGDLLDRLCRLSTVPVRIETDPARLRPSDVPLLEGDASRARAEVGWSPAIPVERTISDTLDWWRSEVRAASHT